MVSGSKVREPSVKFLNIQYGHIIKMMEHFHAFLSTVTKTWIIIRMKDVQLDRKLYSYNYVNTERIRLKSWRAEAEDSTQRGLFTDY
jgi:hypothetical protein